MTNKNNIKITMLGCGSSGGVPLIGNIWGPCDPNNPKNYRTRVSILVNVNNNYNILVDTSPDLRTQMLCCNITNIDGVLYTHAHADHVHGIDDLRAFCWRRETPLPIYGDKNTIDQITNRFNYAFNTDGRPALPTLEANIIQIGDNVILDNVSFKAFNQIHGRDNTLGYRFSNFAYSTDLNKLPVESKKQLKNLDVWIVDCVRYEPHYSHSHLALTLEWIEELKPKISILTHMGHWLDYKELKNKLPSRVVPGYDGLSINST